MALIFFLIFNWLSEFTIKNAIWKYPHGEFFEGYSGRHAIKYYVAFGVIFSVISYYYLREKKYLILGAFFLLTTLVIFQRGVFLGLTIGLIVVFYSIMKGKFRYRLGFILFSILFLSLFIYIVFYSKTGIEYTFYSYDYRDKFLNDLFTDPLYAYKYLNFKGRLEYWDLLLLKSNLLWGLGFGSSGRILEENFGFYNELHNDWLQFFVELGFIGLTLYILFWRKYFLRINFILSNQLNVHQKIFTYTAMGYGAYIIINSFFDHVIDYQTAAICLGILSSFISGANFEKK